MKIDAQYVKTSWQPQQDTHIAALPAAFHRNPNRNRIYSTHTAAAYLGVAAPAAAQNAAALPSTYQLAPLLLLHWEKQVQACPSASTR